MVTLAPPSSVGTLRVHGAHDTPALRLAASALVGPGVLHPPRLPPAAILVVRAMVDPRPGTLRDRSFQPDTVWRAAAVAALGDLAAGAARPAWGPVDAAADAVVFADTAELLACLLADLAAGRMRDAWWWRCVCPSLDGPGASSVLAAHAGAVPAALGHLAQRGRAEDALCRLGAKEVVTVVHAVAAAFTVAPPAPPLPGPAGERATGVGTAARPSPSASQFPSSTAQVAAWAASWCLSLVRPSSPAWRRAQLEDSECINEPTGVAAPPTLPAQTPTAQPVVERPDSDVRDPLGAGRHESDQRSSVCADARPATTDRDVGPHRPPLDPNQMPPRATPHQARPNLVDPLVGPDQQFPASVPRAVPARASEPDVGPPPHGPAAREPDLATDGYDDDPLATDGPGSDLGEAVDTALAGVFLLIGAVEPLGVRDALCALADVGPWSALEAMAWALLGERSGTAPDSVWAVLAGLDGRPVDEPPAAPGPRPEYRIPAELWRAVADTSEPVSWIVQTGRVVVWDRRGIVLADVAGGPATGATTARAATRGLVPRVQPQQSHGRPPSRRAGGTAHLRRLAADLARPLRLRLAEALDVAPARVAAELLMRPGRVHITRSHVDVVFPLADVSLPVRLAGLDRDPGWQPTYGRVVTFHFEHVW